MSELKPCPFCGTAPEFEEATNAKGWWIAWCYSCDVSPTVQERGRDAAARIWNRRAAPDGEYVRGLRAARDAEPTRLRTITEDSWPIARQAITDYRAAIDALIRAQEKENEA